MAAHTAQENVELFHLLFLDQLGRKVDKRDYVLKGGCNLRFYLKSIRYSEDIDLDVVSVLPDKLQLVVETILTSQPFTQILRVRDIEITEWSAPKQTETTQRWKLALRVVGSDIPLRTKIEFSRRGDNQGAVFEAIDPQVIAAYQLSPIMANHYAAHTAFQQKVGALIDRTTTQARDIFDLNHLLSSGIDPTISDERLKNLVEQAETNALAVTFDVFKSTVLSYLHPDHRAQYDSASVWDEIVLRVIEALSGERS
jgi:predicted nucleotidyltransferase component of viral defense system